MNQSLALRFMVKTFWAEAHARVKVECLCKVDLARYRSFVNSPPS